MLNAFKNILNKPWLLFVIIGLGFGLIMLFVTPPYSVADGTDHVYRACEVADGILYNKTPAKITKYEKYITHLKPKDESKFHLASRNSPVMYFASAAGIKLSACFTKNSDIIFYSGRIFNLLVYILLCGIAIRITPIFKYPFMFAALLPMALFQGMSYSADSFHNAFAFLFFAYIFKLIFEKQEINKKDFLILSILSLIGAMCKGLIYPLFLLIFLPAFNSSFKIKNKYIYIILLIISAVLVAFAWTSINYKNLNPWQDVINNPLYMLQEPIRTIGIIIKTTYYHLPLYLECMVGRLGNYSVHLPQCIYYLTLGVFISMLFFMYEKVKVNVKVAAFLIFILFYSLIQYVHLIYWNEENTNLIFGFQGRYFISFLPLVFLFFPCTQIKLPQKFNEDYYKIFIVLFIITVLTNTCITLCQCYQP